MNKPYFEVKTKPAGAKTRYTILADGNEIGSRTTARPYRFARVVRKNQAHALASCREGIPYQINMAEHYEGVARRDPAALAKARRETNAFGASLIEPWIADGSYTKWAVECRERAAQLAARVKELESGPLPEFNLMFVASWHHARKNVPSTEPWNIHVEVIEIA